MTRTRTPETVETLPTHEPSLGNILWSSVKTLVTTTRTPSESLRGERSTEKIAFVGVITMVRDETISLG